MGLVDDGKLFPVQILNQLGFFTLTDLEFKFMKGIIITVRKNMYEKEGTSIFLAGQPECCAHSSNSRDVVNNVPEEAKNLQYSEPYCKLNEKTV